MPRNGLTRQPLWVITEHQNNGRIDVLTVEYGDRRALPVFSFEEEAEMFLWFRMSGTGWRVRQTTSGELVSMLYGPCVDVEKVALDPPPLEITGEAILDLVSLNREDFVRTLLHKGGPQAYGKVRLGQYPSLTPSLSRVRGRIDDESASASRRIDAFSRGAVGEKERK